MATSSSYPLPRERALVLGSLLVLAALAWGLLVWQALQADDGRAMDEGMATGLTMGMGAPLFLGMWVALRWTLRCCPPHRDTGRAGGESFPVFDVFQPCLTRVAVADLMRLGVADFRGEFTIRVAKVTPITIPPLLCWLAIPPRTRQG